MDNKTSLDTKPLEISAKTLKQLSYEKNNKEAVKQIKKENKKQEIKTKKHNKRVEAITKEIYNTDIKNELIKRAKDGYNSLDLYYICQDNDKEGADILADLFNDYKNHINNQLGLDINITLSNLISKTCYDCSYTHSHTYYSFSWN